MELPGAPGSFLLEIRELARGVGNALRNKRSVICNMSRRIAARDGHLQYRPANCPKAFRFATWATDSQHGPPICHMDLRLEIKNSNTFLMQCIPGPIRVYCCVPGRIQVRIEEEVLPYVRSDSDEPVTDKDNETCHAAGYEPSRNHFRRPSAGLFGRNVRHRRDEACRSGGRHCID